MTEPDRDEGSTSVETEASTESSLVRALGYPLAIFVIGPTVVLLALKYLLGV